MIFMQRPIKSIAEDLRKRFDELVQELDALDSFCTSRDCMCDQSAPVTKLQALIAELERYETPYIPEDPYHRMGL
jgi:hypothetical protein